MIRKDCKRPAEVDFPIAEVSRHAAREKSIRHGQLAGDKGVEALGPVAKTTPPGTDSIARVFQAAGAPVLLLFDEVLNYRATRDLDLIDRVSEAIDRLKELRTALISAAVTGKIDVREHAA